MKRITAERLRELLSYNAETGVFSWREARNGRRYVGEIAGNKNQNGYIQIKIDRVLYRAHRLAWLYVTGAWPSQDIDHINHVRHDNRWINIRNVSRTINAQNKVAASEYNKSAGMLGVSRRNKTVGGYQARIRIDGQERRLGTYPSAHEAHVAYLNAKRLYHPGCTI